MITKGLMHHLLTINLLKAVNYAQVTRFTLQTVAVDG